MSYFCYADELECDSLDELEWFAKSYESLPDFGIYNVDFIDQEYEKKFNVKLHYGKIDANIKPIKAVEFPSEAVAALFFLKWM